MEKNILVEADIPELLVIITMVTGISALQCAIGNWALIAFCNLLHADKYTVKGTWTDRKQTVQFKMEDDTFFCRNAIKQLQQLLHNAMDEETWLRIWWC